MKWVRCPFQMPFSATFETASGCCLYFIPAFERLIPCFLTRNTWSCHLLHRSFLGFYDAGRFGSKTGPWKVIKNPHKRFRHQSCFVFDVDHKVWGISKQINELKYVPVSTPYFVSSLEIGLWVKHVPSRIQLDCMNLAQVKHVLLLCLVGSWVLCLLFAPKDLWALVLGICTPCKALRLGDIDDLLRLETCLGSSFWPWSLSRIRTPSYTGSLYSLSICFVCVRCVQDSQNTMRVLMGVSRTGYLKCWNFIRLWYHFTIFSPGPWRLSFRL